VARAALSLAILALAAGNASAQAAPARKAAKELVEYLQTRFAREVAEEGAQKLESRFVKAISQYGDDVAGAARKMGPRIALSAVERHGADGAKILVKFGDNGARLLATDGRAAVHVFTSLGDEGVALMIRRHGEVTAARLPDLASAIAASSRQRDVLAVLDRYGDRACAFIWRNKGVIFGGAALAAFLANPVPYLDGVKELAGAPIEAIAGSTDWTAVFLVATLLAAGLAAFRMLILRRPGPVAKSAGAE